eukprot:2370789-Prymnesium_polylepis.1
MQARGWVNAEPGSADRDEIEKSSERHPARGRPDPVFKSKFVFSAERRVPRGNFKRLQARLADNWPRNEECITPSHIRNVHMGPEGCDVRRNHNVAQSGDATS